MKKYLILILSLISLSALAQQGSLSQSVYRSRVNDTTTVNGATSQGYGYFFWNNQRAVPTWQFWNGTSLVDWSPSAGGGLIDETLTDDITIDVDTHSLTITNNNSGVQVSNDGTGNIGMLSGDPGGAFLAGPDGAKILPDKSGPQPAEGSLFIVGSDGYVDELSIGTSGQVLTSDGTTASWESRYILDTATPSTAGGTITLDMNSQIQRIHVGSASFSTPKTIAISNTTNSLVFDFHFEITDVAAVLTLPATFVMSDTNFDGTDWTPPLTGTYEMGGCFDGTNWKVKIAGPFN